MGKPRIDDIEAAVIQAIRDDAALAYIADHQVQTLGERNVDFRAEQIIVVPPAVLVFYLGGRYRAQTTELALYDAVEPFLLVAVARNLKGAAEAKRGTTAEKGAYDIVEDLKSLFAGKKLAVAPGADVRCELVGVSFEGVNQANHWAYGLEIHARGIWDNL